MYLFVIDKLLFLKNYSMNKLFFIIGAIEFFIAYVIAILHLLTLMN